MSLWRFRSECPPGLGALGASRAPPSEAHARGSAATGHERERLDVIHRSTMAATRASLGARARIRWRTASCAVLALALCCVLPSRVLGQFFPYTTSVVVDEGVELATDVWRNIFDESPRPVLLRRTPYGRAMSTQEAVSYVNAGFIVVSQDVRGRGASSGVFVPYFHDEADGRATIDWIARQSWSNGRIGTFGASAEGIVQYMAMAAHPDALSCTHIPMASHDVYESFFPGGAWRTEFGSSWLTAIDAAPLITTWKAHEVRDGYWQAATLEDNELRKVDHPVFVVGGSFDVFAGSQSRIAAALQRSAAPSSRGDVFFVLGPWTHGGLGQRRQGQLLYPEDAALPSYGADFMRYLSWCLQDAPRPPFANVRYYLTELTDELVLDSVDNQLRLVATGAWREAAQWPPPRTRGVTLFVGGERQLREHSGDVPSVSLAIDPANPTPTRGGGNFSIAPGPYDQSDIDARDDVYTATSAQFVQDAELVGTPKASIWAASATSDVDVVVRLEVVTPTGRAIALTDGIRRGRFVGGYGAIQPLTPNEPALFEVELGPIALRVTRGQAIRIAISGASAPRYEANPNLAARLSDALTPVKTTLTIFRDAAHASQLTLPLLSGRVPGAKPTVVDAGLPRDTGQPSPALDAALPARAEAGAPPRARDAALDAPVPPVLEVFDAAPAPAAEPSARGCSLAVGAGRRDLSAWLTLLVLALPARRRTRAAQARRTRRAPARARGQSSDSARDAVVTAARAYGEHRPRPRSEAMTDAVQDGDGVAAKRECAAQVERKPLLVGEVNAASRQWKDQIARAAADGQPGQGRQLELDARSGEHVEAKHRHACAEREGGRHEFLAHLPVDDRLLRAQRQVEQAEHRDARVQQPLEHEQRRRDGDHFFGDAASLGHDRLMVEQLRAAEGDLDQLRARGDRPCLADAGGFDPRRRGGRFHGLPWIGVVRRGGVGPGVYRLRSDGAGLADTQHQQRASRQHLQHAGVAPRWRAARCHHQPSGAASPRSSMSKRRRRGASKANVSSQPAPRPEKTCARLRGASGICAQLASTYTRSASGRQSRRSAPSSARMLQVHSGPDGA
jgi:uncharacterized protein